MKKLFTILFIAFSINTFGQEGWSNQTSPSSLGIRSIYAINSLDVWAAGSEGLIIHTTDGGVTWDSIPSGIQEELLTVEFINSDTGWVAGVDDGSDPTVLRTTDRGLHWEPQSLEGDPNLRIYDIDFIKGQNGEPTIGYITGDLGYTWKTEDFGVNWNSIRDQCENTFWSCFLINKDTGLFVGTPSTQEPYTIMQTVDGGSTWQEQTNPTGTNLRGVCFGTDLKGIAVGINGTIIYTSDGGVNWLTSDYGVFVRWQSVFLTETGKAWAVGSKGSIAYSNDWGQTWVAQECFVPAGTELWEVYFINDNEGWIVGGGIGQPGVILHTKNGGVSTSINYLDKQATNLKQNYPNPFSSSTQISYKLNNSSHITLIIYDLLGRKIQTLVNEFQTTGIHTVDFDASHLCNGHYLYQLTTDDGFVELKKMILKR